MDIEKQYNELLSLIDTYLSDRGDSLKDMYDIYHERVMLAPASSVDYYHNAFPGGYLDHILRVTKNGLNLYPIFSDTFGLDTSDFDESNVVFTALHHDLGKLGFPYENGEVYVPNKSEWHRVNQGKIYEINKEVPFAVTADLSLYILQYFQVPMSWNEYLTIRIHDGLYDDINKPYYIARSEHSKLRCNLPHLLHMADFMAAKQEYETWKSQGKDPIKKTDSSINMNYGKRGRAQKIKTIAAKQSESFTKTTSSGSSEDALDLFNKLFKNN